jgi:hypothetical protein
MIEQTAPRVISLGGGVDSFAMLLRAVDLGIAIDAVAFCDVGDKARIDPAEWPGTYRHLSEVVAPFCEKHGIRFDWIDTERYPVRDARSLFAWMYERKQIPVSGNNRVCTAIAKVERFEKWLDDNYPGQTVEVWIGFEAGEEDRADKDPNAGKRRKLRPEHARRVNRFPLIEWGLCRCRCVELVRASGHPVPRKSACVFCCYATRQDFQTLATELPGQWDQVVDLEERKPLTVKNGRKLSIKLYNSKTQTGTMLPEYIAMKGRPKPPEPCTVCGAAVKATKATGCGYLEAA